MEKTISLDNKYSTTRRLTYEKTILKHRSEDKFESMLFLPTNEGRQGEGGLRTKGYFKKSDADKPLITIITVVYNGEQHLEETILSVINQSYDNVEYIIIDGASTDGTLEIIKKYEGQIDYWVSERDVGISDAFNKAVKISIGKYINFQGDGDGFISSDALEKVFCGITSNDAVFISARIQRVDNDGEELFVSKCVHKFNYRSLLFRMSMPHQGLFTHIKYFKAYGLFDINNTFCMDYEHLLRSYKEFPKVVTSNIVVARWRDDGLGNGRVLEIFKEYERIKRDNKIANNLILNGIKYLTLLKYHIKVLVS